MSDHRIGRVEVEVSVDDIDLAALLTERTSRLLDRGLAATIERVCEGVSGPGRLHRLDRLTLDVGRIRAESFEGDLLRALEEALRRALQQAIGDAAAGRRDRVAASIELLEAFALTGNLPWWAAREGVAAAVSEPIREAARALAEDDPDALVELVKDLGGDRRGLARLAAHLDLDVVAVVVARRWPGPGAALVPALRRLADAVDVHPEAGPRRQTSLRAAILTAIGRPEASASSAPAAILQAASELGLAVTALGRVDLPPALRRALEQIDAATRSRRPRAIESSERERERERDPLDDETVDRSAATRDVDIDPCAAVVDDIDHDVAHGSAEASPTRPIREREPGTDDINMRLTDDRVIDAAAIGRERASAADVNAENAPSPATPRADGELGRGDRSEAPPIASSHAASTEPARTASSTATPSITATPEAQPSRDDPSRAEPTGGRTRPRAPTHQRPSTPLDHHERAARERLESRRRDAMARLDELYLSDGGLVILWPFLPRFFARCGLLDEQERLVDGPARAQAIALLSVLVRDDPEPPEPALPLAKLLCGASPDDPFDLDRPLDDDQRLECERLLLAVIDHVPALGEIRVDDLRATFLRRPAALAVRDGVWTLTVERRPQDLLLDRFPWTWRWFRLPWMADPLRVEW